MLMTIVSLWGTCATSIAEKLGKPAKPNGRECSRYLGAEPDRFALLKEVGEKKQRK
jgi:hypothetical protein